MTYGLWNPTLTIMLDRIDNHRQHRMPQFRVMLNARCGRACFFCRPSGEAIATDSKRELNVEDLVRVAKAVRSSGISGIKLTGGDPALYGPLEEAVMRLHREAGFTDIEVISRHPRIGERAARLASLGVTQFNMSIDTLDRRLHHELTGMDDLPEVVSALRKCVETGVPVKINTVVMRRVNEDEIPRLVDFASQTGVRILKLLDVIKDLDQGTEDFARRLAIKRATTLSELHVPLEDITKRLSEIAVDSSVRTQGGLGHPMTALTLPSGLKVVVKDSNAGAWYSAMCNTCPFFPCHDALMALRLTADLRLQFCLLRHDNTIDISNALSDRHLLATLVDAALRRYSTASFRAHDGPPLPAIRAIQR